MNQQLNCTMSKLINALSHKLSKMWVFQFFSAAVIKIKYHLFIQMIRALHFYFHKIFLLINWFYNVVNYSEFTNTFKYLKHTYKVDISKMQQSKDYRSFLMKQWQCILNSKQSKMIMVGNIQGYKFRKQGSHYVVLNKSLSRKPARNPYLDSEKSEQKTVFIAFSPKAYNFSNLPNNQMLCHINLDDEQIITKQESYKITEQFFDKSEEVQCEDDKIQAHSHPLYINASPFCKGHSMLLMYPDQQLPQIVGSDILLLLLNIFKLFPNIKVGYNSLGGAASVNHLHFHLLYSEELIGKQQMPIQLCKKSSWLKSSLMNPSEQINLYTVGVEISEIRQMGSVCFVLNSYTPQSEEPIQFSQLANSLAFVFGIIVNELIQLSIPHNVLVTDNGNTVYIFIRDFPSHKNQFRYGWVEFSGVLPVSEDKFFENIKEQQIINNKKSLKVEQKTIDLVKKNVKKHLSKFV